MKHTSGLIRFSDWHEAVELPRSSAYNLLRETGVNPRKLRISGSRARVSFLTTVQRQQLEQELARRRANDAPWLKNKKPLTVEVKAKESNSLEDRIAELERENAALRAALRELL